MRKVFFPPDPAEPVSYLSLCPSLPFVVKFDQLDPFPRLITLWHQGGQSSALGSVTVKVSLCKARIRSGVDDGHGSWKWRHLCRVMKQQQHYTLPHCRLIEAVWAAGTQPILQTAWWIPEWVLDKAVRLSGDGPTWAWPGLCSWFVWFHFASAGHSGSVCLLERGFVV